MAKPKITDKQQAWLDAYLGVDLFNATAAARRAGYSKPKASGADNLAKPYLRLKIEERLDELAMSSAEVLARLAEHGRASVADFLLPGSLELDPEAVHAKGHLIKELWFTAEGPRLKLHDQQKALDTLARVWKLVRDKDLFVTIEDGRKVIGQFLDAFRATLENNLSEDDLERALEQMRERYAYIFGYESFEQMEQAHKARENGREWLRW